MSQDARCSTEAALRPDVRLRSSHRH